MTKEQEAQQAQTIAEISYAVNSGLATIDDLYRCSTKLLEIVDSQAQKIAEQAKEIERLKQNVKDIDPEREP